MSRAALMLYAGIPSLKYLNLAGTGITGSVETIKGLDLEVFHSGEDLYGDLSAFAQMGNLETLTVNNTGISGDVSCLDSLNNLKVFEYAGSYVFG